MKCIGFDATEDHRTYADGGSMKICPEKGLPDYGQRYRMRYPLREWGLDRKACGQIIVDAGLPLPPKSACFFCPAMKQSEIEELKDQDPEAFRLALVMEERFRRGKHFRGDERYTVKGVHRETGETEEFATQAADESTARALFRANFDDLVKPYKYRLRVSRAVSGLGRSFAWLSLPMVAEQ